MKLTSSERRAIFRPNVMMQRLDAQEAKFVRNAMSWVRVQAENIIIQHSNGTSLNKITLNPAAVRGVAQALANSMVDTYGLGEISFQNELLQAEQIKRAKQSGSYTPNIVPFAAMREDEIDNEGSPFTPRAGLDWYNNYTLRLSGVHSVDALEYAKGVITTGIEQGLAQPIVMNLLRERLLAFSEQRLENIARTETAKIYEQSRYQLMNDNEEVVGYEFAAIMDSRTSVICSSRDGKFIRKGEEEGWVPPLHYQCRSVLLPVFAWEQNVKYSAIDTGIPALKGFGSPDMVIPETARNKIYIGGIPELRQKIKVVESQQEQVLTKLAMEIKDLPKGEYAYIVDENGKILYENYGEDKSVEVKDGFELMKDNILLHNHPKGLYYDWFSLPDLEISISHNVKETWIATPQTIVKLIRPTEGWGENYARFIIDYDMEVKKISTDSNIHKLVMKYKETMSTHPSFDIEAYRESLHSMHAHAAMKKAASKYGMIYKRVEL